MQPHKVSLKDHKTLCTGTTAFYFEKLDGLCQFHSRYSVWVGHQTGPLVGGPAPRTRDLPDLARSAAVTLKMFTRCGFLLVWWVLLHMGLVGLFAQTAAAQSSVIDGPDANPGRPTVSTPATLTPAGYVQFETGVLGATSSPEFATRYGFNEIIKLSIAPRLELFASTEPAVHFNTGGNTANGVGEVFLGAQAVIVPGEGAKPTLSASYSYRSYDGGAPDLDFGSPTNSFLLLVSGDVKGFHYDTNAIFNEIVQRQKRRLQFGQTLSISHPLARRFTVSGEIWRFTQPFLRSYAVGNLWALSYAPQKNLVLDAGFEKGLTSTSTRWEVFAGFTYLLPRRLWRP